MSVKKSHNLLYMLLKTLVDQLIYFPYFVKAIISMNFLFTNESWFHINQIAWMNTNICAMYFLFNWGTFQHSFLTIASRGTIVMHIFAMFVCLISDNLLIPTYGKHNI